MPLVYDCGHARDAPLLYENEDVQLLDLQPALRLLYQMGYKN